MSSTPREAATLENIIANTSPVERIVRICVAGRLVAEHQRLEAELEAARRADHGRLGGSAAVQRLAQQILDVQDQMRQHTYAFRFRALHPKAWSDLIAEHPDPDKKLLVDPVSFPAAAIAACCVEPVGMDDPAKLEKLLGKLSHAQTQELFDGAWEVNTTAPKELTSFVASVALHDSATSSTTARLGGSPAASSSDE